MHFIQSQIVLRQVWMFILLDLFLGCIGKLEKFHYSLLQKKNFSDQFVKRIGSVSLPSQTPQLPNPQDFGTFAEFGEECQTNGRACNGARFLQCIDGQCVCNNPLTHVFDEEAQICVGLSGSPCGAGKPNCVKHSVCLYSSCQCLQGFGETSTNICMKNHKESCGARECNGDNGLGCIDGICECIDSTLVHDPFSTKCLNPQTEFDKFAKTVVQRVVARTVSDAASLVFLPIRLLIPGFG